MSPSMSKFCNLNCNNNSLLLFHLSKPIHSWKLSLSVTRNSGMQIKRNSKEAARAIQGAERRIKEMLKNEGIAISVSPFDTAWVAIVPSLSSSQSPCFPQCLNWVLENQFSDGSWGFHHRHPSLLKDALNSTLACILALKKWNVGEEHIKRGLHFIGSNFAFVSDENQHSPIGFNIIFPGMLEYARDLGLNLPLCTDSIDALLLKRDLELRRGSESSCERRKAYLAYLGEGLGKLLAWEEVMKYQKKNGSLFNSPSTTAAALMHLRDSKCFTYLQHLLKRFGNAVPTAYPLDIYTRLCIVDSLERLGVARHFREEIMSFLNDTYRCWLQNDEELYSDIATCAMAFRLLRMNGYEVSSEALVRFKDEDLFSNSVGGYPKDLESVLQIYRASEITTLPNELVLEKVNSWSRFSLERELSKSEIDSNRFFKGIHQEVTAQELCDLIYCAQNSVSRNFGVLSSPDGYFEKFHVSPLQVEYTLNFPHYAILERLENRRFIENFNINDFRIWKTSFKFCSVNTSDILGLAVEDFKICQAIFREEFEHLERWVKENRLDQLEFTRNELTNCYFSAAATLFDPEMAAARISWTKNGVLTTVVDDFFDKGSSREEQVNLIELFEKFDQKRTVGCCSKNVEIIFIALRDTINELGTIGFTWQRRDITGHLIEIWLALLKSMMKEAEWQAEKTVPTMDEYIRNGWVSFALGPIILPALYFIGPEISEEAIRHPEYVHLLQLTSTCGRLLNDVQGFKREGQEGKLNSISLYMMHGGGGTTKEEAVKQMMGIVEGSRREVLRLVVKREGSVVPRACKDLFWKMAKILHVFYMRNDGFRLPQEMARAVNSVVHEPVVPPLVVD